MGLHVSATECRVMITRLEGSTFDVQCKKYPVHKYIRDEGTDELFDSIVECLDDFLGEFKLCPFLPLPLGFTFSFPLRQEGLRSAFLTRWSWGFHVKEVVGKDVVRLLNDALQRKGTNVIVYVILNETTGVLLASAWKDRDCRIVLTGSNICYVEEIENVKSFEGDKSKNYVLVEVECECLGDNGQLNSIRRELDWTLDADSLNPGKQIFDKMVAEIYLGELVRIMLEKLIGQNLIFGGKGSSQISRRGNFYTKYMFAIESERGYEVSNCRKILNDLGLPHITDLDCINLRYICRCVSKRAAKLTAAVTTALINKMKFDPVTIACDIGPFRFHPKFEVTLKDAIASLVKKPIKFNSIVSEDGYGLGSALASAIVRDRDPGIN